MHLHDAARHSLRGEFRADFPRRVTRRWREAVDADAQQRGVSFLQPDISREQVYTRYGSTLIAALVVEDTILVAQIGDGDVVLVRPDGTIECPVPPDPSAIGGETRSLSSRDAHLLWRTSMLDRDTGGVLLAATDGVSDSFDTSGGGEFFTFVKSLSSRIRKYGIENVAGAMSGWLDQYSELASGDDMTLVFVCINGIDEDRETCRKPVPGEPMTLAGF
jgi:serine/threonine protein phosphatase PrpC